MKYVYFFGGKKTEGKVDQRDLLGGKGANLAEMARLGLAVPPGCTVTTDACRHYLANESEYPDGLEKQVAQGIQAIEKMVGRKFGDAKNPLLLSVRSGAAVSMPGMMNTILNLGLNDKTVVGLINATDNARFGFDSYRRFIQMYGDVVLQVPHDRFESALAALKQARGVADDTDLTADDLEQLVATYQTIITEGHGANFPQDPQEQLWGAISAVFGSWNTRRAIEYRRISNIPGEIGTAANVQAMVYGNLGNGSATGVAFTRNPATGDEYLYGEYLENAQGEDVVAGIRTPLPLNRRAVTESGGTTDGTTLEEKFPDCYREFEAVRERLELHYKDMQDIEFTIEQGKLWILQTRRGQRTAEAAARIAVAMVREGVITEEEALMRVTPAQVEQLLHPRLDPKAVLAAKPLAKGLAASPGGAAGKIVFTADDAVEWVQRGEKVLLVRSETSPDDIHGMHVAEGFLTARGGLTSHAAVVARGLGKPCVSGCHALDVDADKKILRIDGVGEFLEGHALSIDGSSGSIFADALPMEPANTEGDLQQILEWADARRQIEVWTNADTEKDSAVACAFGAQGIGLTRTEHMFFEKGRIELVRAMILASGLEERQQILQKLLPLQREDFRKLLGVMGDRPVTIRLLDPPLHEFLPQRDEEVDEVARELGLSREEIRRTMEKLHESNPMLGHRGCRLGMTYPEVYAMQVQAIVEAGCACLSEMGVCSALEIELPLVAHLNELIHLRKVIVRVAEEVIARTGKRVPYVVGVMLELPRACIIAGALAEHADFLSFGTNDLTQTALGVSRDDAGRFLPDYVAQGVLPKDPFVTIDREGVGMLMRMAVERARAVKPNMRIGICGEHGGDPESIAFCCELGLDYVSCSPYRVPVARLAAAQATMKG